jgi:hypothetical protein
VKRVEHGTAILAVFLLFFSLKHGFELYFDDWQRTSQIDPLVIALSASFLVVYLGRRLFRRFSV